MFQSSFEGHKIKVTKLLESIKEKPNDSDNNGSGSDPSKHESSESKSGGEQKEKFLTQPDYDEDEEGAPLVEEIKDGDMTH